MREYRRRGVGFRRRNRGPHQFRSFGLDLRLVLGKRLGYGSEPMPPHNITYTAIGATMLSVGWFGFNAGSALAANELAASAFCATHFAAAAAGLTWATMEWIFRGKPTVLGTCSGVVAGLVCITPASGFVTPMSALLMGVAVGIVCFLACTKLKSLFGYDDSLDVFGVHGVGGTLGPCLPECLPPGPPAHLLILPLAATPGLAGRRARAGLPNHRRGHNLGAGHPATFIILKVLDATMGLRVSRADEIEGLDTSQHGEEGYIFI